MDKASKEKDHNLVKAHITTANTAWNLTQENNKKLWEQQDKLKSLVGKKPKLSNENV